MPRGVLWRRSIWCAGLFEELWNTLKVGLMMLTILREWITWNSAAIIPICITMSFCNMSLKVDCRQEAMHTGTMPKSSKQNTQDHYFYQPLPFFSCSEWASSMQVQFSSLVCTNILYATTLQLVHLGEEEHSHCNYTLSSLMWSLIHFSDMSVLSEPSLGVWF